MIDIDNIIKVAKTKESWSANRKYNYGPIAHLEREVFADGADDEHFSMFYSNVRNVTDARSFFAREYGRFDIYVRVDDLFYVMERTFPEIPKNVIWGWIAVSRESYQSLC